MVEQDLETWLEQGYVPSFRTACLILGNRADAEEAVQEAFLRAWRFRASLASVPRIQPWLYRVVVNACYSKLRQEIPHRDHRADDGPLAHIPGGGNDPDTMAQHSQVAETVPRTTIPSLTPGFYTLTVTGTAPSATHSTAVTLTVTPANDFSISASPTAVSAVQGGSTTSTSACAWTLTRTRRARAERLTVYAISLTAAESTHCAGGTAGDAAGAGSAHARDAAPSA